VDVSFTLYRNNCVQDSIQGTSENESDSCSKLHGAESSFEKLIDAQLVNIFPAIYGI